MPLSQFQIDFSYEAINYFGLVTPFQHDQLIWYAVDLESANQETNLRILAKPSTSSLEDWDYECGNIENAAAHYDKGLLQEVGEAIEKHILGNLPANEGTRS